MTHAHGILRKTLVFATMLAGLNLPLVAQTAAPDPAPIESAWQKANSKYDGARAAILKDVDRQVQQGPFRADWESLQKYQAPAVV